MIVYDSHHWKNFLRYHGSVLPTAFLYALPASATAVILKILDIEGILEISKWDLLLHVHAWGVFTSTVTFLLVFRTGQCYTRFLSCSGSLFSMKVHMYQACSNLTSFCCMSKASKKDIENFKDKLIHLFSTLHAVGLASVSDSSQSIFHIVDVDHMPSKFIHALQELKADARVELTYLWINNCVIKEISTGLLNVPPPILSRIFQEMEKAIVELNNIASLMQVPFPFPYAQACIFMMFVYMAATPVLIVAWTSHPMAAGGITFLSSVCFMSLELTSRQLENPFGDDANDLPVVAFQDDFNKMLQLLLHPSLEEDFFLLKHKAGDLLKPTTWHTLDGHRKSQDDLDEDFAATMDSEKSMGVSRKLDKHKNPTKVAEVAVPVKNTPANLPSPPAKVGTPVPEVKLSELPKCPGSEAPAPADNAWISQFTKKQSHFEESLLRRLDDIVNALTKPRLTSQIQETPAHGGAVARKQCLQAIPQKPGFAATRTPKGPEDLVHCEASLVPHEVGPSSFHSSKDRPLPKPSAKMNSESLDCN